MSDTYEIAENGEQRLRSEDFEFGQLLVRMAGELITKSLAEGGYTSVWKEDNTPVTSIDIAVNQLLIEKIREAYPNDRVYGEEQSAEAEGGLTWVLDPVDGTQALEQGLNAVTCCLARLDKEGKPLFGLVYNPATDELFAGKRGKPTTLNGKPIFVSANDRLKSSYVFLGSRVHGEGLATNGVIYDRIEGVGGKVLNARALAFGCTQVAKGSAEGAFIGVKTPFEAASVQLIVEGAGGVVTDLYGQPPDRMDGEIRGLVVSNGKLHEQLLATIRVSNHDTASYAI